MEQIRFFVALVLQLLLLASTFTLLVALFVGLILKVLLLAVSRSSTGTAALHVPDLRLLILNLLFWLTILILVFSFPPALLLVPVLTGVRIGRVLLTRHLLVLVRLYFLVLLLLQALSVLGACILRLGGILLDLGRCRNLEHLQRQQQRRIHPPRSQRSIGRVRLPLPGEIQDQRQHGTRDSWRPPFV